MTSLRISFVCLTLAIASGGLSLLPEGFSITLPETWDGALRGLCVAALVGFAVSFMVGLARTLQQSQGPEASMRSARGTRGEL